jgi:hypothetical protein
LAEQDEDPGNGNRKHQACDPSGFEGCFPHPLTVLRSAVEQLNERGGGTLLAQSQWSKKTRLELMSSAITSAS